mgnify:CR=1 FL=1
MMGGGGMRGRVGLLPSSRGYMHHLANSRACRCFKVFCSWGAVLQAYRRVGNKGRIQDMHFACAVGGVSCRC